MPETFGASPMLTHCVYFELRDNSPSARQKLIDACKRCLTLHPGTVHFAVGLLADLARDVNDRQWDVALHLVFASQADHDRYQEAPRHHEFVAENHANWKKVRVFDSSIC